MEYRRLAVDCFNGTWDLIDKADRTEEDILKMIHMAHASRYCWGEIGTPLVWSRGEWQISRVYYLAKMGDSALYHGMHALRYCLDNDIGDFDLAFAYEAIARAYSVLGKDTEKQMYIEKAREAAKDIKDLENRDYLISELGTII